jgi:hypothetical protein
MCALVVAIAASAAGASGCAHARPCNGVSCAAACPRDSTVDASGRCACTEGDVLVLGACVPLAEGEAFCGPAGHVDARGTGCAFRECGPGESLDVASGACVPRGAPGHGGPAACPGAFPIVERGAAACIPAEAACPRGSELGPDGRACVGDPVCPPGSLLDGRACRPIVTTGGRLSGGRVDVGAWAALALGIDGGLGARVLCQPLAQRANLFPQMPPPVTLVERPPGDAGATDGAATDPAGTTDPAAALEAAGAPRPKAARAADDGPPLLRVAVKLFVPDQDVSRVHADVQVRDAAGHALSPAAEAFVTGTVGTLVELLRGLGGESSTAAVQLEVRCGPRLE